MPSATSDNSSKILATGGGAATSAGILFEQQLGALIGGWMLAGRAIDSRLNLGIAQPIWLRFETEAPVDDILIATSDGGFVAIQAKTTLSSSSSLQSPYGKTVGQFVRHWLACRDGDGRLEWNRRLDHQCDRLVLAVSPRASSTVRVDLPAALKARGEPGSAPLSQTQVQAFNDFETCVRQAWGNITDEPFTESILDDLARLSTVLTFELESSNLSSMLLSSVSDATDANTLVGLLSQYCGELMARRGGADVRDMRQALVTRGARLQSQPVYRNDISKLKVHTDQIGTRLSGYEVIDAGQGRSVRIDRDCQSAVEAAARTGSLLIVGEPGVGKSGVLNSLARRLKEDGQDVLELAVDCYSVETLEGLAAELRLEHSLLDVLDAWDGPGPAWLIIDALDATRGGKGEGVFRTLIEQVLTRKSRWCVVASIRTFDLRLGQQYRSLFKGAPPVPELAEHGFSTVRHISIPPWAPDELRRLLVQAAHLEQIFALELPHLRELATVPFNLRLMGDLVANGAVTADFSRIATQAELLNLYWDHRIAQHGCAAETCLRRIVDAMVRARALRTPRLDAAETDPTMVQTLSQEGVLVIVDGDWIQFRHHLLFDYVASKVYLTPDRLLVGAPLFPKAEALGLMLAPALTFVLRELWSGETHHARFWMAVARLLADETGDPVIRSVASRISAELGVDAVDGEMLAERVVQGDEEATAALVHIVGALTVRLEDETNVPLAAWVRLALVLARNPSRAVWPLRLLGFLLIDRVTVPEQRSDLGVAVRALLEHAFMLDDPSAVVSAAIGFVADTYETDSDSSRTLLRKVFEDGRFALWGWEEVPALASKIEVIVKADPAFAADIYRDTYARDVTTARETLLGASQILSLRSNARQDYDMARYSLSEFFPKFLRSHPHEAVRAFVDAVDGYVNRRHSLSENMASYQITVANRTVRMHEDYSHIWAHNPNDTYEQDGAVLVPSFVSRLREASEAEAVTLAEALIGRGTLAIYWARLFLVGAERVDALTRFLWPFASSEAFIVSPDTRKDAIDLIVAGLAQRPESERQALEQSVFNFDFSAYTQSDKAKNSLLRRLFGAIGKEQLITANAKQILDSVTENEVVSNERLYVIQSSWGAPSPYSWLESFDPSAPQNASLMAAIDATKIALGIEGQNANPDGLTFDVAMTALLTLKATLAATPDAHVGLRDNAEGILGEGAEKIISANLLPPLDNPDPAEELISIIEYSSRSECPRVDDDTEERFAESVSWGSPSARIGCAEAVLDIVPQRPAFYRRLVPFIDQLLVDPHPAVRLQVCLRLARIWEVDNEGFWIRVRRVLENEQNTGVIDHFVSSVLWQLLHHDPVRGEPMVLALLNRFGGNEERFMVVRLHLASMVTILALRYQRSDANAVLTGWISDVGVNAAEVQRSLLSLRDAVAYGLGGQNEDPAFRARAQKVFHDSVEQANLLLARHFELAAPDEDQMKLARKCAELLDVACRELYFASSSAIMQNNNEALRQFFYEVQLTLRLIGDYSTPHTIHYLLQLLEKMIACDPALVFDLSAHALLNGGRRNGYQYESLGADLLVRMVGVFLADHKKIFEDAPRRQALIECLEAFLKAGWPAARRLLYRLPDLIQ